MVTSSRHLIRALTTATVPTLVVPRLEPLKGSKEAGYHVLDDLQVI